MKKPMKPLADQWGPFEKEMMQYPGVTPAFMSALKVSFYAGARAAVAPLQTGGWVNQIALINPLVGAAWCDVVREEAEEVLK